MLPYGSRAVTVRLNEAPTLTFAGAANPKWLAAAGDTLTGPLLPAVMSWKALADMAYSIGKVCEGPSREARLFSALPWSAMAMRAAHCGAASLVPPNCDQGAAAVLFVVS